MRVIARPDNPSTVIHWTGEVAVRLPPSQAATVAIPGTYAWGPMAGEADSGKVYSRLEALDPVFGDDDSPGRRASILALGGARLPNEVGAGGIIPIRMGTGAAAAAATLENTAATPANAVTFTALYKGTRGNRISLRVETDPAVIGQDRLHIQLDGVPVETYAYPATDLAALAARVAARPSKYGRLTVTVDGTALEKTTTAATGGLDGTLSAATYLAALAELEYKPFTLLSFPNLTDEAIQLSVASWLAQQAAEMRPVIAVMGGAAGETLLDAADRSAAFNAAGLDPSHIVNVGIGTWRDDLLARDLSTAELAPRIAGVLAARGRTRALTGAELSGVRAVGDTGPASDELRPAWEAGVTAIRRTSSDDADVAINKGVTAFTQADVDGMPLEIFSEPRFVRLLDLFLREAKRRGDREFVGQTRVTHYTRTAWRQLIAGMLDELIEQDLALPVPKPFVTVEPSDEPDLQDSIPFEFGCTLAPTTNNLVGHGRMRLPGA